LALRKRTGNNEALSEIREHSQAEPLAVAGLSMGNIDIDAYIVGLDPGGELAGL